VVTTELTGLAATIRIWRDRLSPAAVGLPVGHARRATGLRREELADLAGISVDYVVRLEQGRAVTPSAQVLSSLARALQLTRAERDHLYRLARQAPPNEDEISDLMSPGVSRIVNRLGDIAVAVFAADWQLIWWSRGWVGLLGDPSSIPPARRNFARDTFPDDADGPRLAQWSVSSLTGHNMAIAVVSDLRRAAGRFPADKRLTGLVASLARGNDRFARLWAAGTVAGHRSDHKIVHHPSVGPILVDCDVLTDGETEQKIVIMTAAPDTDDETRLRLAVISGAAPAHS
jgi:transcriptional regulator with XRE-family HTH domain